jgi:NAD+ kinase
MSPTPDVPPRRLLVFGEDGAVAAAALARRPGLRLVERAPDVVLCHGGDGTLLRAEREWPGVPKLPVRAAARSRPCPEHTLDAVLSALVEGRVVPEELGQLELRIGDRRLLALNDVVLRNDGPATAVRLRVRAAGLDTGEITGDGIVVATPFGSTGYYRSITRATVSEGLGVAFNNCTEPIEPLHIAGDGPVQVRVLRGPAVLARDNDPRIVPMRDGHGFVVGLASERALVLGLDALRCQRCRKADGSAFNAH